MQKLLAVLFDLPVEDTGGCSKLCAHEDCPVWAQEVGKPGWCEANRIIRTSRSGRITRCRWQRSKLLPVWSFLARMGVCAGAILMLCTVFQVHPVVTVLFGCSAVAFYQLWQWLEKEGRKWD